MTSLEWMRDAQLELVRGLPHRRLSMTDPSPTGIEALVCRDIASRQQRGIAKYGTTVSENPLQLREWLSHQYEELLDAAVYCRRAMAEIDRDQPDLK